MTFEQHVQAALSRHENGFHALPSVLAALEALAKERESRRDEATDRAAFYRQQMSDLARFAARPIVYAAPEPRSVSHWGMVG